MSSSNGPQSSGDPSTAKKPFSLSLGKGGGGGSGTTTLNFKSATTKPTDSSSAARSLPLAARGRRPPRQLHDDDEDSEDETSRAPAHEEVTGFDTATGAAISAADAAAKQPLVIPVASNNNWRDRPGARPRGTKNLLPKEVQALQEAQRRGEVAGGAAMETEGPSVVYGLSFAAKNPEEDGKQDQNGDGDRGMEDAGGVVGGGDEKKDISEEQKKTTKPMTQDEVALQALIRESKGETAERGRSDLVIQATAPASDEPPLRYDETSSFRADIASRPESATLDQYNAIPVEEFGAALLRGMGWKEGQAVGKGKYGGAAAAAAQGNKARVPERRPGFLGIGAKDVSGGKGAEAELGAWGKAAMRKGSRKAGQEGGANTEGVYMPVMMRNTKTGEFITEEELSSLKKEAKKKDEDDDWKARRDRNLERSGRDRDDRLRESDRDSRRRDYDGRSSNGSSRRDRSRSSSDRQSRRRRYDDGGSDSRDDRYYRERDRDRDSRRDRERNRDNRDRDSDRDKDRDRDSDRDRERERDGGRSHRSRDDDRYSSRHSSNTSSRHRDRDRDRDRDSDRDSHRRRRYDGR